MLLLTRLAVAEDPPPESAWRVWFEPKFLHSATTAPIADAQQTEFAGGVRGRDLLTVLSKETFAKLNVTWSEFFAKARANSTSDFVALKPEYVRNRKKVIQYAVLQSEEPFVASAVLAPKFLETFADTLGPKVLVIIPNQFTAYVFPALASAYQDFEPVIRKAYRDTAHPVSTEVFEFSAEGIKAVGAFESP
ncbi:MAG TPA: hypothetical protein VGH90_02280 [Chthoniobacteraceae bacterium]